MSEKLYEVRLHDHSFHTDARFAVPAIRWGEDLYARGRAEERQAIVARIRDIAATYQKRGDPYGLEIASAMRSVVGSLNWGDHLKGEAKNGEVV